MRIRSKERKSNRLPGYDYSQSGYYFVTICTKGKIGFLGEIENDRTILNKIGKIVKEKWGGIPVHNSNVGIDQFIIMPNHIHGIIIINRDDNVGTEHCSVPTNNDNKFTIRKRQKHGLLSRIVKSFKEAVTRDVRKIPGHCDFVWQRSYYDHVIKNEPSLGKIRAYIEQNPAIWNTDEYNNKRKGGMNAR